MSDDLYIQTLKKYFGYDSFRSIQLDIIRSIGSGHDTIGLMPTGGGKSITFQVPALAMEGVCIVITPLIALMKDQVEHLRQRGIKAECIHSDLTHQEIQKILDNTIYGAVKFLYLAPERLQQPLFLAKLYYMKVCFITVDEAHCISQWGYDFRPSYLKIADIREHVPHTPILALTASATPAAVKDIQEKLLFGQYSDLEPNVFRMSFRRDNISYVVRIAEDKEAEMIHILKSVPGSAIVYTRNREKTKETAKLLTASGISASFYHAGLDFAIKDRRQQQWQDGELRVIVATNAFGMGIDKADVRLVIHLDCPDSLEEYYQEAGRCGRDGKRSYAVLLYNGYDSHKLPERLTQAFPPKDYIRRVYDDLCYFFELALDSGQGARYEFNEFLFCKNFHHFPKIMVEALGILQNAGYIQYESDPDNKPRVQILCTREDLYYINNLSPTENNVLTTLLRMHGSLFVDLTYINSQYLAHTCAITEQELHVALKQLAQRRIVRYVPRRNVPLITFVQQRIDSSRLRIGKEVYEDLEKKMEERLSWVRGYAEETNVCRQQILLDYFGEYDSPHCQHCDVCLSKKQRPAEKYDEVNAAINTFLADGQPHLFSDLHDLHLPETAVHDVLEHLIQNDLIIVDGPYIKLKKAK